MMTPMNVKSVCKACGWHVVRSFWIGDLITGLEIAKLFPECPWCGGTDFMHFEPSLADRVNPVEIVSGMCWEAWFALKAMWRVCRGDQPHAEPRLPELPRDTREGHRWN